MQFADKDIEAFWNAPMLSHPRRVPSELRKTLYRKLQMFDAAHAIADLRIPPGNRLELLRGTRFERYSIRVNSQWRLCFTWENGEATGVEFCDYH